MNNRLNKDIYTSFRNMDIKLQHDLLINLESKTDKEIIKSLWDVIYPELRTILQIEIEKKI